MIGFLLADGPSVVSSLFDTIRGVSALPFRTHAIESSQSHEVTRVTCYVDAELSVYDRAYSPHQGSVPLKRNLEDVRPFASFHRLRPMFLPSSRAK